MIEFNYDVDAGVSDIADVDPEWFAREILSELLKKYLFLGGDITRFTITTGPTPENAFIKGTRYSIVDIPICGEYCTTVLGSNAVRLGPCDREPGHPDWHADKAGRRWY